MGAYDVAVLFELVERLLFNNLSKLIDPINHGLYRHDRLIIIDTCTPRKDDVIWGKLTLAV